MKIGLITTLDTNIGDDFIREGLCKILCEVFNGKKIEFLPINKHDPYSVYSSFHPIHFRKYFGKDGLSNNRKQRLFDLFCTKLWKSKFQFCDLIVQCGAPVFWPNCSQNAWAKPIWSDVVGRLCERIPVFNLAAGSCFPWVERECPVPRPQDHDYLKRILRYCTLTTVRDQFAKDICEFLGVEVPLIPCSAFLLGYGHASRLDPEGYILINYMRGGGHYDWSQGIDAQKWEDIVREVITRLSPYHKLAFLSHSSEESRLAAELDSTLPIFFPKNSKSYLDCVAGAKFGICNRMHASVAMASMGVPSIAVCTDTRLLMVDLLGLKTHYVKDVTTDLLEYEITKSLKSVDEERGRLLAYQQNVWEQYISVVQAHWFKYVN